MEKPSKERVFGLDAMRAVAILLVLSSNAFLIYPDVNGFASQIFAMFGFWGVEVFFVLNGFLIGKILINVYVQNEFTIHSVFCFLKRVWYRTLPNYFLVLLLNFIVLAIVGVKLVNGELYFLFFQNFSTSMLPFFPELWCLSVMQYSYLLMPFTLYFMSLLVKPKNKNKRFIWVVLVLVFLFIGNKAYYNYTTRNLSIEQWNISLKGIVVFRIDAILVGTVASWLSSNYLVFWKNQKNKIAFVGGLVVIFLFVGVGYFRILIETNPFFWNVLYLPLTSVTFALFLPFLSQLKSTSIWFSKGITFISLISYSIYLLHYSIILQMMKYLVDTSRFSIYQMHLVASCYLGIVFFSSYLLYNYFQKPIMNLQN